MVAFSFALRVWRRLNTAEEVSVQNYLITTMFREKPLAKPVGLLKCVLTNKRGFVHSHKLFVLGWTQEATNLLLVH